VSLVVGGVVVRVCMCARVRVCVCAIFLAFAQLGWQKWLAAGRWLVGRRHQ